MAEERKSIGERIRQIREKAGMSQEALGRLFGKGKGAVFKYEQGQADPDSLHLAKIAELGNVSLDWLITGRGPEPRQEMSVEEAIIQALRSKPDVAERIGRELVGEAQEQYRRSPAQDPLERKLLAQFRQLHPAEKEKVIEIAELYAAAKDPRKQDGGGSDCQESNCG